MCAKVAIATQAGYESTLDRTRAALGSCDGVLELGYRTGTTALHLAGHVQSCFVMDISFEMIAIVNEKHTTCPVPALTFRTATAEALHPCPVCTRRLVLLQDTMRRRY